MRIFTAALLDLLADLLPTTSKDPELPGLGAIELHTGRGEIGAEPGHTDLLCGSSTDRIAVGHTFTRCDGQLAAGAPILLPVADAKAIISVFKPAARNRLHAVDIHHDSARTLRVSEDPNLVDDGLSLRLILGDPDDYPAAGIYRILAREQRTTMTTGTDRRPVPVVTRTLLSPTALEPFVKIAKRAKDVLHVYRTHQDEAVHVQIGDRYRGLLLPAPAVDGDGQPAVDSDPDRPDVAVHTPELPEHGDGIDTDGIDTATGSDAGDPAPGDPADQGDLFAPATG